MAIEYVSEGLFHYEEKRSNEMEMKRIQEKDLEDGEIIIEVDYANPFRLISTRNAQSEYRGPPVISLTAVCEFSKNGEKKKVAFHGLSETRKDRGQILFLEEKIIVSEKFN